MFCPECGKELAPGAIFCSKCGRKLPDRLINEPEPPQAIDASSPYDVKAPAWNNTRNIHDTLVDISSADTQSDDVYPTAPMPAELPLRGEVNTLPTRGVSPTVTYEQESRGTSPVMVGVISSMATLLVVAFVLLFIKPGYMVRGDIKTDSDLSSASSVSSDKKNDEKYSDTVTAVESNEPSESSEPTVSSEVLSSKAVSSSKTTSVKAASKISASKVTSSKSASSKVTSSKSASSKVTSSKSASSKVTSSKSASSKVTSSKSVSSKAASSKSVSSKVTSSKSTSSKVTSSKSASSKVTSSKAAESRAVSSKEEQAVVSSQPAESSKPGEVSEVVSSEPEYVPPVESSDTQSSEPSEPPVESEPEERNAAYEEAMRLSTSARPSFDEFEWCFGQNGLVYTQPEGTEPITDPLGFSGGWKAMVIYNPSNSAGTFIRELDNVDIGINGDTVDLTIDWYLMSVDSSEMTNEEGMPDTMFLGTIPEEYTGGGFRAFNGQRTVNMVYFWREGTSQYALGTLTTEDGLPAYIALTRP